LIVIGNKMIRKSHIFRKISLTFLVIIFSSTFYGCSVFSQEATPTPADIGAIQTAGVSTFIAEITRNAPTITPTEAITETFTPSPTETRLPTSTPTVTTTPTVTIEPYLVLNASNTSELLPTHLAFYVINPVSENPCNFYLKPVLPYPYPERSGNLVADVTSALNILFSVKQQYIGIFPNPFSASGHILSSIKVDGYRMDIYITGWPGRTDNLCTNRQMRDQMFKTVHQISDTYGVTDVIIWLDNLLYDDYMIGG
jgi:hypothetical protein